MDGRGDRFEAARRAMGRNPPVRPVPSVDDGEETGPAAGRARMNIAHVITRMILGGAQENTLLSVEDQQRLWHDEVTLITGPAIGPEGSLLERAAARQLDVRLVPELRREMHPWRDWRSYRHIVRLLREVRPQIVHTHSSK